MANDPPLRLLLSIRPRHAREIILGTKRVELRRVRPAVGPGDEMIVYETSPTCAVVCRAIVDEVIATSPLRLWRQVGTVSGVTRSEFMGYFHNAEVAFAIRVHSVEVLEEPVKLAALRKVAPGFTPPQSYHYLRADRTMDRKLAACL